MEFSGTIGETWYSFCGYWIKGVLQGIWQGESKYILSHFFFFLTILNLKWTCITYRKIFAAPCFFRAEETWICYSSKLCGSGIIFIVCSHILLLLTRCLSFQQFCGWPTSGWLCIPLYTPYIFVGLGLACCTVVHNKHWLLSMLFFSSSDIPLLI